MRPQATSGGSSYEDWFLKRLGVELRVAATSYGFATVAALLVGTEFVATMHAGLATQLQALWPLKLRPCPVEIPAMTQAMQWHRHRTQDPGLRWLRGVVSEAASQYADQAVRNLRGGRTLIG